MEHYDVYKDIQARTKGEIYIGVVGPVRTGKSTFIKRFMDLLVLPGMEDERARLQARDELPQSAAGRTIMTTEPKFIPKEAAVIRLGEDIEVKVRLIDCVGFLVEGAAGHIEDDGERMVKTPWFDHEIPFAQAAEIGTQKVICDHSTIGIAVTGDGSFGELPREAFVPAEEKTVGELKRIGRPFVLLVNSQKPYSEEAQGLARELEKKYAVSTLCMNCEQMKKEDIYRLLEQVLYEFPVQQIEYYIPKWVEMLEESHEIKQDLLENVRAYMDGIEKVRDVRNREFTAQSSFIRAMKQETMDLSSGTLKVQVDFDPAYYYRTLSELTGAAIDGEYQLIAAVRELSKMKKEYEQVQDALQAVRMKGYGVISPVKGEITLEEPVVIRQGNKYGVKIRSEAPSIHLIRANIETEIAPIVGSEQQANDLIAYIRENQQTEDGIWNTNIFGKSVEQLVEDGIRGKLTRIGDECQEKLQDTMQKVVNDLSGGMVCIII